MNDFDAHDYRLITDDGHWCPNCRGKYEDEGKEKTGPDNASSSGPID